ncbi:homeobox-domain-containing protein [Dentipellis sp. KUC8613]|nr:homeobox-domain-containing protein [Dentipellis sp. KUC8613]
MFSFHRPLSRASTETTATLDDNFSTSDDASSEVPYARRRATDTQIQALYSVFETNPYPTREERSSLAEEIGMEYKTVTVWFQNRRQSAQRKAWTQNSRARKRAEARQLADAEDTTPRGKSMMSLDHIASLNERSSSHAPPTLSPGPLLTPRKANSHACPTTPLSSIELWRHMPSSPPEDPASPGIDKLRLSVLPAQAKSTQSLEWACAKDRVSRRQLKKEGRGKENRPPKPSLATRRQTRKARSNTSSNGDETTRRNAGRAYTEEYVFAARGGRSGGSSTPFSTVNTSSENVAADVEAAMLLLDFAVVKGS